MTNTYDTYDTYGRLSTRADYFGTPLPIHTMIWEVRTTSMNRPSGRNTTWTYSSNVITETTAGRSYHKTYSSDGTVSSAEDPGGTIYYTYYPDGKVKTITAPGTILTQMQYDIAGNQTKLIDPSAGTINYTYNGFGELLTQQNARLQTTTNTYYSDGRIARKVTPDGTTRYRYNSNKQLANVNSYGTVSHTYGYDSKGRVTSVIDTIPGTTPLTTSYTYDALGRNSTLTHPSGLVETNNYNSFGYLFRIDGAGSAVWTTSSMNPGGQVTSGQYGTNLAAGYGYDSFGFRTSITAGANNSTQNFTYGFNATTGNLSWRQNNNGTDLKETFNYDNLDRLDNVYKGILSPSMTLDMDYDPNKWGITTKTDVGTLMYNLSGKPYAVSNINPVTSVVPEALDSLTYTSFESVSTIEEGAYFASFVYNPEDQRTKMEVKQNGSVILTRWYLGSNYIKETSSGVTKEYTFIGGDAYTAPIQGMNFASQGFAQYAGWAVMGGKAVNTLSTITSSCNNSENAGKILLGKTYTDENNFWHGLTQSITRYTWEGLQTWAGYNFSQFRNTFGGVDRVDYLGGATFVTGENREYRQGVSLGNYPNIWLWDEIEGNFEERVTSDPIFMHEYGHTFDSQWFGPLYLPVIGIPSASGAL